MRRARDREFGLTGGEFLVIDLHTREVRGYRRSFKSTFSPRRPNWTNWAFARRCNVGSRADAPINSLITRTLNGDPHLNDTFVPEADRAEFHQFLKNVMENDYGK